MNTLISPIIFHCKPNFFNNIRKNTYNVPILKILIFICIIQICDSTQFDYNAFKNTINQKNSFLYPENEHQNSHNPHGLIKYLELDTSLPTVTCKQCIQLWRFHSKDQKGPLCGIHAPTCQGNACFMRQCKKCGAYQYMSGCLKLSKWQLMDLQLAKQKGELVANRAGATMLCQDNDNHTTCFCNKREKCNDIHMRNPFTTFQGSSFSTILQVDEAIAKIDPNYGLEINLYGGYQTRRHDLRMNSSGKRISFVINFALFILYIFYFF
uniref:Transmembrane protein n=1 Tax=Strongyloides venezuelensis TaxID=75913 RepID=A0A0K0F3X1_STRVS